MPISELKNKTLIFEAPEVWPSRVTIFLQLTATKGQAGKHFPIPKFMWQYMSQFMWQFMRQYTFFGSTRNMGISPFHGHFTQREETPMILHFLQCLKILHLLPPEMSCDPMNLQVFLQAAPPDEWVFILKCICTNCKMYLFAWQNVFVQIAGCICWNSKMFFSSRNVLWPGELGSSSFSPVRH